MIPFEDAVKYIEWLGYNFFIPLSPLVLVWAGGIIVPSKHKPMLSIIKNGQLFFYCTTILAILLKDIGSANHEVSTWISPIFYFSIIIFSGLFGIGLFLSDDADEIAMGSISASCTIFTVATVLGVRITENLPL